MEVVKEIFDGKTFVDLVINREELLLLEDSIILADDISIEGKHFNIGISFDDQPPNKTRQGNP